MTKTLLRMGIDPNANDGLQVWLAAADKNTKILKALLNAGANVGLDEAASHAKALGNTKAAAILEEAMQRQPQSLPRRAQTGLPLPAKAKTPSPPAGP